MSATMHSGFTEEHDFPNLDPVLESSWDLTKEKVIAVPQSVSVIGEGDSDNALSDFTADFDLSEDLSRLPAKELFRIGEVAELLDLRTSVLRFWETEFSFLKPEKSKTGQRVYRRKEVEQLFVVKHLLYREKFSIEGAKLKMRQIKKIKSHRTSLLEAENIRLQNELLMKDIRELVRDFEAYVKSF